MKTTIIEFKTAIIALLVAILAGVGAKAQTPAWTVAPSGYRYDMSLYMDVTFKSQPMDYSEYIVAAFVGDECRGIAETLDLPDGSQCLYMRVRSNQESGETLTFRYRNRTTDEVAPIEGVSLAFKSNKRVGYPSDPWKVVIERYYDVTIQAGQGGTVSEAGGRLVEGTGLTITATPSEGHYFDKWSDGNTDNPRVVTVQDDISLTAGFGIYSYKLTYTVDGESYNESEVEYGTALTAIDEPVKEGYTFSGWQGLPETMPAHDVTVGGTFTINTYVATFKIGDEFSKDVEVVYGQPVVAPEAPAKEGHTFAGWQDVPATMPAHDITVLGSYTVNKYKLTYTVDGEPYNEFEVEYGTALTAIDEPVKEGYSFSGWQGLPASMPANDVTVAGTFTINTYVATFKIGDEFSKDVEVVYGQPIVAPEAPEKVGHTFAGWEEFPETMPAHDITVTGSYTVNKYKLTYAVDGESYNESEVEYGTGLTAIAEPTKEGYTFSGWQGLPETMPANDVTVVGTFTINTYVATFKIGDEFSKDVEVVYGQPIVAPDAPEKVGHTFAGWDEFPETMPAHDITVTGSYTVNKYKLNYVIDGEPYKTVEVEYGATIVPEVPEKEGHTFSGWQGLPETMPAEDVTVTGTFSINTYKATFKIGEEVVAVLDVVYGEPVVAPEAPEKVGHTFAGWDEFPETMPAHDITVTGSYTVNKYKLSYVIDGEPYKTVEVEYGATIVPEAPEKEGYTFSGWEGLPETMPAEDVTVTGTFSINTYKATFKIGEEVVAVLDVVYGEPVVAPEAPEKVGHTFAGWDEFPETMPAHDITVTGSYTVNKYKLSYVIDGEPYKTVEVEYGATIVPEAPEKEGYTFSGWEGLPETMPAEDVTVTGTFSINNYKLTVYLNDEVYMEETLEYGSAVTIPDPVLPEQCEFQGWQEEIPETMPAHDVTIHGTYIDYSGVSQIRIDDNETVWVCTVNGQMLYGNRTWSEVKELLRGGIYIINGVKYLIR